MDKRSWPWQKKMSADDHTDDKIRRLNEKLVAADDLVKQHVNVAEEAVSGWEKTKTEYISMKHQLDIALEQKQAAEIRVLHLDGALKQCMLQLRQAREEQEQTIHEAIIKRSREWDALRLDLEERLADVQGQLMDLDSQRTLLCTSMQEQAEALTELGRLRSVAEAEIKDLQAQVQMLEKKNTSLKYEVAVLDKELGIRSKEVEMNTRSLEMATQQHIESRNRIAKLESDCQRLRALVRKKLPGPGALRQMKMEAGVDMQRGDACIKQRPGTRTTASSKGTINLPSLEGQAVSQRSPTVAPTSPEIHLTDSFRENLMSEDGYDEDQSFICSWASSPVRLSLLNGRESSLQHPGKSFERLDLINDFLEIERLASLPSENQGMKPIVNPDQSISSISEKVLTNGETTSSISDVSRTSMILNYSGRIQKGSHIVDCESEFRTFVCEVMHIVEGLASNIMADFKNRPPNHDINDHSETQCKVKLLLSELEVSLEGFHAAGDAYLYGKLELTQFMSEVCSILDELNTGPKAYKPLSSKMRWRLAVQIAEQDIISDLGSPFSSSSNSDRSDLLTCKDSSSDEAPKVRGGRQTSKVHASEQIIGISKLDEIVELKEKNSDLETKLQEAKTKFDLIKTKLEDSEKLVTSLRKRLTSAELTVKVAENGLTSISAAKAQLELRLQDSQHEGGLLRDKVKDLELCNEQEKRRNKELQVQAEELRTLNRAATSDSSNGTEKSIKDQEIADATEKLAQCQHTIFVLGQQLKDIVKAKDGNVALLSHNEVQDDPLRGSVLKLDDTAQTWKTAIASIDPKASTICGFRSDVMIHSPKGIGLALQEEKAFNVAETRSPLHGGKALAEPHYDAKKQTILSKPDITTPWPGDEASAKPDNDVKKQVVPSDPKPDSKKKAYLHSLLGADVTKSWDLEPSTPSSRKHANRFSKFFSRNKSPC